MNDAELYKLLIERAEAVRNYVHKRIPRRMRRIVSEEDVLQEIWITAFRKIDTFTTQSADSFDRWLMTIARTRLLNAIRYGDQPIRAAGRVQQQPDHTASYFILLNKLADPGRSPSSENACSEAVRAIRMAINGLPDDYRRAITMHHLDGRSQAEVASAMNKTTAAINGLLHRGMIRLKLRMGEVGRFFSDVGFGLDSFDSFNDPKPGR